MPGVVAGHGEQPGGGRRPRADCAARLYALHAAGDESDTAAIPDATIEAVATRARESWARTYSWER